MPQFLHLQIKEEEEEDEENEEEKEEENQKFIFLMKLLCRVNALAAIIIITIIVLLIITYFCAIGSCLMPARKKPTCTDKTYVHTCHPPRNASFVGLSFTYMLILT